MNVYVVSVWHKYPDVDGPGEVFGVCTSEEKANELAQECREYTRPYLDPLGIRPDTVDDLYDVLIEEFELV